MGEEFSLLMVTHAVERTVAVCFACEMEVYQCDKCHEYLKKDDSIGCLDSVKHYCDCCTEDILKPEPTDNISYSNKTEVR
jgi:hypothetical protein